MKILIFNGGPHKGNTWRLTQIAKSYIQKIDKTVQFCEVHLSDIDIPFCTGCSNCFRKGHKTCPHHNKIQPIIDMIYSLFSGAFAWNYEKFYRSYGIYAA